MIPNSLKILISFFLKNPVKIPRIFQKPPQDEAFWETRQCSFTPSSVFTLLENQRTEITENSIFAVSPGCEP